LKKIISVVGARPNFMKMAPVHKQLLKHKRRIIHKIVHTGQHYDRKMSDVFFKELNLPKPDIYLGIGSKSHAEQKALVMMELEKVIRKERPDMVLVYGDVNSTSAAALVCSKQSGEDLPAIPVAHIESGLRSYDRTMPEEINRIVTDVLADYLFVTEPSGLRNLHKEGVSDKKIFFVGNTMIDSLISLLPVINKSGILGELCVASGKYAVITLHRPSNVDSKTSLLKIINIIRSINDLCPDTDIIFPVHPRTLKMLERFGLNEELMKIRHLIITEPLGYVDFMRLVTTAGFILTDSGGIQEETTFLKIPCITLRENTERPVTTELGTNTITGLNEAAVRKSISQIAKGKYKSGKIPKFWDGNAAERIVKVLLEKI
jgi:UDP-N-acetylglucosamine 2-epimerase (non-hydrolysing)